MVVRAFRQAWVPFVSLVHQRPGRWAPAVLLLALACHDETGTKPGAPDTTPPAQVTDLTAHGTSTEAVLSWTAPGNDGMQGRAVEYDLRCYRRKLTIQAWDSAQVVNGLPAPKPATEKETFTVSGLPAGTWWFRLRTADGALNWSDLSNVASAEIGDTIPPRQVTDLKATSSTATTITLTWTAPGGDGATGTATRYDLRYSTSMITESTWAAAAAVSGVPAPHIAETVESYTVTGMSSGLYYFALKAVDDAGNWSVLSDVASDSTRTHFPIRLTTSTQRTGAEAPSWSPDGRLIAFDADWESDQGPHQLYTVPDSGGDPVKLTEESYSVMTPVWKPLRGSNEIAYYYDHLDYPNPFDLWGVEVMTADPGAKPTVAIDSGHSQLSGFVWSPTGDRIAYSVLTHGPWETPPQPFASDIMIAPLSGGAAQLLITGSENSVFDWAQGRIAFSSNRGGGPYQIWTINEDGTNLVQVTNDSWNNVTPRWSPDGRQIAFSSDRSGSFNIWIMTSGGQNPVQITLDPGAVNWDPTWSPDGTRLAYVHKESLQSPGDIWVIYVK